LYSSGLILLDEVREKLEKIGYKYVPGLTDKLLDEQNKKAIAQTGDPFAQEGMSSLTDTLGNTSLRVVT
jgi:hypothetical protein